MWLIRAPIVEERKDGEKECKGNDRGTPQGGVMTPPREVLSIFLEASCVPFVLRLS